MVPAVNARTGLHLHTSNRLEVSVAELAAIIARPAGSFFEPETIVVQSVGMSRWLSLRLAEAHGICANVRFPFPQKFISEIFAAALPNTPTSGGFEREILPWRIMQILPAVSEREEFAPVSRYLAGDRQAMKRYQLSQKIGEVFDRYLVFRPELILRWDAGEDPENWQAILWRELTKNNRESHPPALARRLKTSLAKRKAALPQRLSVFGVSSLPRLYLNILDTLASYLEIHLFLLEPTDQWWHEIVSAREEARMRKRQPTLSATELHLDRGNPLLASMGSLGRDFLGLVYELTPVAESESFVPPNEETILAQVQREIFLLQNRHGGETVPAGDRSLQFHSCHSPMREMEVLHDQLLAIFEQDPALEPRDVVVMMPDLTSYAPFIEAVFDTPEKEEMRIPFTIADRSPRAENHVVDTFLAILELSHSRYGASSVLHILESPAVLRRFQLAEADLETIRVWIDKAAIRWGIDEKHRKELDLPPFPQNTWRRGLDRLLLGYAMPLSGKELFKGILPIDDVEGSYAEVLGNFLDFTEALFWSAKELSSDRTLRDWQVILRQLMDRFLAADEFARELHEIREVLESLGNSFEVGNFSEAIPFEVILAHLQRTLGEKERGTGFLVGRVTFCALKPMRSIPFKVVCLVGMNSTAYPRKSAEVGFDLIANDPQPGDRSIRDDDRYLFLEALLSARRVLYLSYVGQSIKDGSPLPPSVLVSELLDYLDPAGGKSLVTRHRLQPFNADYFRAEGNLFSYSAENCRASMTANGKRITPPGFFVRRLVAPEEESRLVDLETLYRFYRHPPKFFLQDRLGIRLPNDKRPLEDREPFELGGLAAYQLQQELVGRVLQGVELADEELLALAGGQFPAGEAGRIRFRELRRKVLQFAKSIRANLEGYQLRSSPLEIEIGDRILRGRIDGLTDKGLFSFRLTTVKSLDLIRSWICHLALNLAEPTRSWLITDGATRVYQPVNPEESRAHLNDLLQVYDQGLLEPLPFAARASLVFAQHTIASSESDSPLAEAEKVWNGTGRDKERPEKDEAYNALAFRNHKDRFDEEWQALARRILVPLLHHSEVKEN